MEEKEIIEFLKGNKTKGIAFKFLPEEVQEWIKNHWQDCAILTAGGAWDTTRHYLTDENSDFDFDDGNRAFYVFCLLASYIQPESSGSWVEFVITDNAFICSDEKEHDRWHYFWWEWQAFLTESDNSALGYIAFGGWQYEDDGTWFTTPQLFAQECFTTLVDYDEICKPAIPKRIRFWREK